jgi:hypothetical protein
MIPFKKTILFGWSSSELPHLKLGEYDPRMAARIFSHHHRVDQSLLGLDNPRQCALRTKQIGN